MAIKPSPRLAAILLLFHATVAAVVILTVMPLAVRLAMLVPIVSSLLYYLARDVLLLLPGSWHGISPDRDGVLLIRRDGVEFYGHAGNATVVSPYFVVLSVRLDDRFLPIYLTIFPDALGADEFRELCVRLRFA